MKVKTVATISAASLAMLLMASVNAHDGKYVGDSFGGAVKDSSGACVKSSRGNMFDGCEAVAPTLEPEPKVAPPPPPPKVVTPPPPAPPKVVTPPPPPPPKPVVRILNITLSGGSHFAFDSAKLNSAGKSALDGVVSKIKSSGARVTNIIVVGHTDSIGSNSYNQRLSQKRAQTVAGYLASKGLNRAQMKVSGKGETQPIASNKTKAGRAKNRRVEILVQGQRKVIGR
jgi:OOP family OmpA-OmpF porin